MRVAPDRQAANPGQGAGGGDAVQAGEPEREDDPQFHCVFCLLHLFVEVIQKGRSCLKKVVC